MAHVLPMPFRTQGVDVVTELLCLYAVTYIAMRVQACGSGATLAGVALGNHLTGKVTLWQCLTVMELA
jgi:uncharacterized membrane protein